MATKIAFTQRPIAPAGKSALPVTLNVGDSFTFHHKTYVIQQINAVDGTGQIGIYLHSPSDPSPAKPKEVVLANQPTRRPQL